MRHWYEYLQPGMTVIDIGANVGKYTLPMLERVGPTGRVIAIEPQQECVTTLRRVCPKATVIQAAVLDRPGTVTFYHSVEAVHGSIEPRNVMEPTGTTEPVPVITVDQLPRMDFLKVDAQGAEAKILRGATACLLGHRPIWRLELWKMGLMNLGDSVHDIRRIFEAADYVPDDETWDAAMTRADSQVAHGSIDLTVLPRERAPVKD